MDLRAVICSLLLCLAALALPACDGGPPAADDVPRVISAGAEPRRELRLIPSVEAPEVVTIKTTIDITHRMNDDLPTIVRAPTLVMQMLMTFTPAGDGSFAGEGEVREPWLEHTDPPFPGAAAILQTVKPMTGLKFQGTFSDRGEVLTAGSIDLPENSDPAVATMAQEFERDLLRSTLRFPDEPIGVGGSWVIRSKLNYRGVDLVMTMTYTVAEIKGDEFTVTVKGTQTAARQKMTGQPGASMTLESLSGSIDGTLVVSKGFFSARSGTVESETTLVIVSTFNGETIRMTHETDLTMAVATTRLGEEESPLPASETHTDEDSAMSDDDAEAPAPDDTSSPDESDP